MIQSAEGAECGLACMAMVGRYHGHDINLNGLRQRFSLSLRGASLRALIELAELLTLSPRAIRVELADLAHVSTPAILHWDTNHFVVLKSVKGRKVIIHDPARGVRTYDLGEVSNHFTGIVLELTPASDFGKVTANAKVRLASLWSRMIGFWSAFGQVLGLSFALQIVAFALPFQMQLVIDEGVFRADINLLTVLAIGFGLLIVIQAATEALRSWALLVFGQLLSFQMIGNIVRHLLRLPSDYFEKRHVGDILSRVASANAIQEVLTRGAVAAIIDGLMAAVAVIILFLYSPVLAMVVVVAVVLNAAIATAAYPALRARMEDHLVQRAREQSHIMESVRAATIIKVMGKESERESTWRNIFASATNAGVSVGKFNISLLAVQGLITGLQTVAVIYLGARAIVAGDGLSVGMLFAFLSFRQTFTDRANALVSQMVELRSIGLHLDRLSDIVTVPSDVQVHPLPDFRVSGEMSLSGVGFRYASADPYVLRDVNLHIQVGEFLAITGPSGGGKTTLVKLLLGLQEPTTGSISLDGRPATPQLWRGWRSHVGVVSQDDRLLSGTIAENISFFDPDLDMGRVVAAATSARIHEDTERMAMGYLSLVGDMGSALSGGQKQRLLLARALYRQPTILFLDEGTANLDEATEKDIVDLIDSLPITRVVVAHRPALLRRAHRVLVVAKGTISPAERQ